MPRRTNEFQQLINRIQAALHGSRATVTESAMVHNFSTQADTEVDILINFDLGGFQYRTAVECRNHQRPAGPGWIQELRTKRDDCRLDKIIAVSARGFSAGAVREAESHGVVATLLHEIDGFEWDKKILPEEKIVVQAVRVVLPTNGILVGVAKESHGTVDRNESRICLPDGQTITPSELSDNIRNQIHDQYLLIRRSEGPQLGLPIATSMEQYVEFIALIPEGTTVLNPDGTRDNLKFLGGYGTVHMEVLFLDLRRYLFGEESWILDGRGRVFDRDAIVTLAKSGEENTGVRMQISGAEELTWKGKTKLLLPIYIRSVTDMQIPTSIKSEDTP